MKNQKTRMLVEGSIMLALAYVLSLVPVWKMPFGGSVTAGSMIPIIIFAIRWGLKPGLLVGFAFGLLNLTQNPYIVHPAQLVLDYPLAFTLLGLAGVFHSNIKEGIQHGDNTKLVKYALFATILGFIGRYISHVISGIVFFGEYAPEGQSILMYSLVYNSTYLLPDMIVALFVISIVIKPIMNLRKI